MSKILNPSKLLPSSKSSIIKSSTSTKTRNPNILTKTSSLSKGLLATRQSKDASDVNNKLVKIDKFLKSDLIVSQKKAEVKRKGKEKQDFDEAEKKLETPKLKGFKIPSLGLPSLGFFDRVKRFLFFTALGWLLPKIIEFLPKLEGFAKIVGGIYNFAEGLFGNLFNGFMSLVKFGGDLKDKTLGFIASAKAGVGGNYQKEFEKLEKQFNTFANVSIIAGLVGLDMGLAGLDEFNKQRKKGQKPVAGKPKPSGKPKVTTGKGGEKPSGKPKVTTGKGGKVPGWWNRIFKGPFAKLKGPLSRFAGAAVPGLGAVVGAADAKARFAVGDKIGGALASVSAALDAATVASALTGVGIPVAGILGSISIGIDVILLIRDILSLIPFIPKNLLGFSRGGKVVKRYQGGGTTRGGRPVGGPRRRVITPTRRKPPRVTIPKTQPGKDVGGEKKVKEFYAKPEDPNKKYTAPSGGWLSNLGKERQDLSAFDTLKKMSGTLKSDETLAKGILGVMSSGIDMALGQKPDKKVFKSFFDIIGYIADTLASQRASKSMSSLRSQIGAFAEGGTIPSRGLRGTYSDANTGDMLAKLIGPTIDQRVNEAIESIEKQLQMKGGGGAGGRPPGADPGAGPGGDAPGARLRDGSNAQIEADLLEYFTAIYGKNAALGIVANMMRESGYRTRTPENDRFEGIVQWDRKDRWPRYVKWAESKGLDPYSRSAQAQYVVVELKQYGLDDDLKNAKSPEESARIFYEKFERGEDTGKYPGSKAETKHIRFLEGITRRNPDIGKRKDDVLVKPPSPGFKTGSFASGLYIGSPGDNDGEQTGLNMNLPGGIGTPIYAPFDLVYKTKGTDGTPSVGLQGTAEALGPSGRGFGYYGSYYYTKNGKEYEVLMGHFRDLPYKGSKDGDIISKGTLLGYQGASGRSVSGSNGVYPHISLHVNGVGFGASNDELVEFANLLGGNKPPKPQAQPQVQKPRGQSPKPRQQATNTSRMSGPQIANAIKNIKPGQKIVFPGVGSVQGGKDLLGRPQTKYYDPQGKPLNEQQFIDRYSKSSRPSISTQPSSPAKPGPVPAPNLPGRLTGGTINELNKRGMIQQNMQGGGLVSPSKPNRSIPNSFASYETPGGGMMIAIQPMIIERQVPVSGGRGKMIAFPVLVAGVNNNTNLSNLSQG